ncbi:MAG: heme exporter protein CcmD [Pseudorhodoplanes sp.]
MTTHFAFIAAAYGVAIAFTILLIAWVALDYRALHRALAECEKAGWTRRSESSRPPGR